jgi:hypothetical protein
MGILEYLIALSASAPAIALWIAVIIYGTIKLSHGGGRAERFLIAGGSIKLFTNLLGAVNLFIVPWLFHLGHDTEYFGMVSNSYVIFRNIISMAGILCLLYAFWVKFNRKKVAEISS